LREEDAYPADAEDGYGWEKLYMERVCRHYTKTSDSTRASSVSQHLRPLGTYDGGREKSPAAICRKIALAEDGDEIEVWGDGEQTRSYCYIDDLCRRYLSPDEQRSSRADQPRTGSDDLDQRARRHRCSIAGKKISKRYDLTKPQGVRGRNSDNTRLYFS
jgi:hypothetical protein